MLYDASVPRRGLVFAFLLSACNRAPTSISADPTPCDCACAPSTTTAPHPPSTVATADSDDSNLSVIVTASKLVVDDTPVTTDSDVETLVRKHEARVGKGFRT